MDSQRKKRSYKTAGGVRAQLGRARGGAVAVRARTEILNFVGAGDARSIRAPGTRYATPARPIHSDCPRRRCREVRTKWCGRVQGPRLSEILAPGGVAALGCVQRASPARADSYWAAELLYTVNQEPGEEAGPGAFPTARWVHGMVKASRCVARRPAALFHLLPVARQRQGSATAVERDCNRGCRSGESRPGSFSTSPAAGSARGSTADRPVWPVSPEAVHRVFLNLKE